MEDKQNKRDLGVSVLATKSLAADLAQSKQSKNLLGDIRKETRRINNALKTWKLEDISRLELKLSRDSDRFSNLKSKVQKKPVKKEREKDTTPREKDRDRERERQEKERDRESQRERERSLEKEKGVREKQLRDKGFSPEEAKRKAAEDTRKSEKYRTPGAEVPKESGGIFSRLGEGFGGLKDKFKLDPKQLEREAKANSLLRKIFRGLNIARLPGDIVSKNVGGVASDVAGVLANTKRFGKSRFLGYFDSIMQAGTGDIKGAAESAVSTKVQSEIFSKGANLLAKVPGLKNIGSLAAGATALEIPLTIAGIVEATGGGELLRQGGRTATKAIGGIKSPVLRQQAIRDLTESKPSVSSPNTFGLPGAAEGGIVTKPTLAMIGEGGEKEYIVPQSKLQDFIGAQSSNADSLKKPARTILGVVNNFISQFGSGAGDIRRMVGGDILRMERIFGRERFVLPIFTKGEGSFDKIVGDTFKDLVKGRKVGGGLSKELYESIGNLFMSIEQYMSDVESMGMLGGPPSPAPEGGPIDEQALQSLISGNIPENMARYLTRLSYLETRLRNIPNAEGSEGMGYYQAFNDFNAEATRASGGLSPRSSDFVVASKATMAWIYRYNQPAYTAIISGNYDQADSLLKGTWPSLPGGSQAQPQQVQNEARKYLSANVSSLPIPTSSTNIPQQSSASPSTQPSGQRPTTGTVLWIPPNTVSGATYELKFQNGRLVSVKDTGVNAFLGPQAIRDFDAQYKRGEGRVVSGAGRPQQPSTQSQSRQPQQRATRYNPSIGERAGYSASRGRVHAGRDLAIAAGTPLKLFSDSIVTKIGFESGYGNYIIFKDAKGFFHLYGHMRAKSPLAENTKYPAGTQVGEVGNTGSSRGSHLHWEISTRDDVGIPRNNVIDPLSYYSADAPFGGTPGAPGEMQSIDQASQLTPGAGQAMVNPTILRRNQMFRRFLPGATQRIPALNVRPSGRLNRGNLSSLPPTSQSGAVVAVQPVIINNPPPTQSQRTNIIQQINDIGKINGPVNISWVPIVQTRVVG